MAFMRRILGRINEEELEEFRRQVDLHWRGPIKDTDHGFASAIAYMIYVDMKSREKLQKSTDRLSIVLTVATIVFSLLVAYGILGV